MATGGNQVKVVVSSDDRDLLNTWQKQNAEILKNQRALQRMGQAGEQAGRKTAQGLDKGFASAKQFIGAIAGVTSVVGGMVAMGAQLRREYDNLIQRQKTAADKQVDFAGAISQTVRNAGGLLSAAEVQSAVGSLSDTTGVGRTKAAQALGAALSARGATRKEQALESVAATRAALKFAPELEASGIASLAGVAIDISKRENVSPEAAIGFIQNVGGLARVTDLENLVQNVAPTINNLGNFGFTPAEAGSLVTTITQGTGDFSGAISRTAALNFGASIRKAFPGQNPVEVIGKLRNDPRARKKFLDEGVFGKGVAKPSIENILTPGTIEATQFDEGPAKIGSFDEGEKTFGSVIAEINSLAAVKNARLRRTLETGAEALSLTDISGGQTGITREGLGNVLRASGASSLRTRAALLKFDLGGGLSNRSSVADLADRFEAEAELKRARKPALRVADDTGGGFRDATPQERAMADVLQNLAESLDRFNDENRPAKVEVTNDPVAERGKANSKPPAAANSR